jgi:hypothetical protein
MQIPSRDIILTLNWSCDHQLIDKLGLRTQTRQHLESLTGVVGALLIAAESGDRWVSYSRNRNRYTGQQRYYGPCFTYRYVVSAADQLDHAGLLEHQKAKPSPGGSWQSRMRASPALIAAAEHSDIRCRARELIRLKDGPRYVPYLDTAQTLEWRDELEEVNAALGNIDIDLPGVARTARHFLPENHPILITPPPALYRVFLRGSWEFGGRCHAWWQNCPGRIRDQFHLNGQPVARPDYCALNGQILYAQRGARMDGDVYDVGSGFTRDQGKLGFQVALNARDRRTAIAAIAKKANLEWRRADALLEAVQFRNTPIADAFGRDLGVKLMRIDSELILACLKTCISEGILGLPVHDEIIVASQHASRVAEIMAETFESRLSTVTPCQVRLKMGL